MPHRIPYHRPPSVPLRQHAKPGPSAHAPGYGRAWERLRRWILAGEPLCRQCAKDGRTTPATEVDQIIPKSKVGTGAVENLQPLGASCHSRVGSVDRC